MGRITWCKEYEYVPHLVALAEVFAGYSSRGTLFSVGCWQDPREGWYMCVICIVCFGSLNHAASAAGKRCGHDSLPRSSLYHPSRWIPSSTPRLYENGPTNQSRISVRILCGFSFGDALPSRRLHKRVFTPRSLQRPNQLKRFRIL
jgi:hypothetical protein